MVRTEYKVIVRSELRSERVQLKKGRHYYKDKQRSVGMVEAHDHLRDEKKLREVFKDHDADGDGRLIRNELREAFRQLGAWFPAFRAARALAYADTNGDGFINHCELDQLVHYVAHHGYTID
ncbi:hypothetical protein FNV43_RR12328 [Rhamnella rubrinervis]|uniref:EF-hand domain-containing protein n=1 Tax=Rhamnella rubrinervis TaxID=2594499 RepID=A0A8K0H865_9ROSA|nr:hypothetical protein FNV43_RR12328 [Rhamnella rubrinervis]